ncbi:hypothetical protein [Mucilaginibacter agri]|uniref:Uncharacterized protein n=1 Tax=Mucilaginibacter agri TaxID=2695265 RepID=A0A965ZFI3_9SPHI|nr:hypothetical protein [Mucilaginibacter agri]NCD70099.1 hypothetical protein [Mucilaginibacter agri]
MKTELNKGKTADKGKTKIETDLPMSEKDEIKKAEEKMRQAQKGTKRP